MQQTWTVSWIVASALVISAVGIFVWKKRRSYVRVGKISKLLFFPVKSLKHMEVTRGNCTKSGLEVNGIHDRSFMLINEEGVLISQRQAPRLVLLKPEINGKILSIFTPSGKELKVKIKDCVSEKDKIVECRIFTDSMKAVDCGDEAASFFQSFLELPSVRLVRYFPSLPARKYLHNNPFERQVRKDYPIGFQDFAPFHLVSQASIEELNSKLDEKQISVLNFRPNIVVEECKAFEEDSWRYMKFPSGAELDNFMMTTRCLLTTNTPSTGILTQKEPLVTMRKFRIPKDPELLKKQGSIPCMGINCGVMATGPISVGDDVFADIGQQPEMQKK